MIKLNFGAGEFKFEGFVNIDVEPSAKPDVVCDIRKSPLPFENGSVEFIQMSHSIEHIEQKYWNQLFSEFHRVLAVGGDLYLAYPEFERCAKNFLENHLGLRDLFRATLYGRQLYPGDYHVVPMVTSEVIQWLLKMGFRDIRSAPDPDENWNTVLICKKGEIPPGRDQILKKEIFG